MQSKGLLCGDGFVYGAIDMSVHNLWTGIMRGVLVRKLARSVALNQRMRQDERSLLVWVRSV